MDDEYLHLVTVGIYHNTLTTSTSQVTENFKE